MSSLYDLPKNTVDVLLMGSSHMYASVSPMDLWNEYGITSYNPSFGLQSIPTTYFELRELLKVQKPKVVVLETFMVYLPEIIYENEKRLHYLVDNVPFSSGVHEAIQTLLPEDSDKTEYYVNFYTFHNNWKILNESYFRPWVTSACIKHNRGASIGFYTRRSVLEKPDISPKSETIAPADVQVEYLYKISELCRDEGIQLVFMLTPFTYGANLQMLMNYVYVIAEAEGVPYLNFHHLLDESGFDYAEDLADFEHVNYSGARKITSYLGEYLQTNYQLEDHRTDPAIADLWNKDYEDFSRDLNNIMMKTAANTDEYFNYLQTKNYITIWNAYSEVPLSETVLPTLLEKMGFDPIGITEANWSCVIGDGDQLIYGVAYDERPNNTYMIDDMLFSFGDGITASTNPIGIHVGRYEHSIGNSGVNLAVYDPVTRTVVDSINIDLDTEAIKRS